LDPRLRTAANLYNFSLWRGFSTGDGGKLVLDAQTRSLPIGNLAISHNPETFPSKYEDYEKFEPAEKYAVRGISNRNRAPGIGMPLIGIKKPGSGAVIGGVVEPVTAFLRADSRLAEFKTGVARASLEFYSTFEVSDVEVKGKSIPLETDTSTVLAYKLEGSQLWSFGIGAFLGKEFSTIHSGLYQLGPYQPGRIPVVLVHGTASSPVWWAEMFNTLYRDPTIRQKFQFWYFIYKSNNPVVISASDLRNALQEKVAALDPDGKDAALRQMVVIGHSQGGLLTKLAAVDTGDNLVRSMTGKGIRDLRTTETNIKQIREILVLKPLPFVKQVVFIATPHRGSFLSTQLVRKLIAKLVRLPRTVLTKVSDIGGLLSDDVKRQLQGKTPTSIDGMSPDNPLLKALADIPLGPGIRGHSIIAIKDESTPPQGDDGVVEYASAHLEGMDSEFIVRSKHSCQGHPFTIEEVRRILLEHLGVHVTGPAQEEPAAEPALSEPGATMHEQAQ
jgi:pimeloyl-ACP methyl ester carboxylesterase